MFGGLRRGFLAQGESADGRRPSFIGGGKAPEDPVGAKRDCHGFTGEGNAPGGQGHSSRSVGARTGAGSAPGGPPITPASSQQSLCESHSQALLRQQVILRLGLSAVVNHPVTATATVGQAQAAGHGIRWHQEAKSTAWIDYLTDPDRAQEEELWGEYCFGTPSGSESSEEEVVVKHDVIGLPEVSPQKLQEQDRARFSRWLEKRSAKKLADQHEKDEEPHLQLFTQRNLVNRGKTATPPSDNAQGQGWAEQSRAVPVPDAPPNVQGNSSSQPASPTLRAPVTFVGEGGQASTQNYTITFSPQLLQRLRQERGVRE